MASKPKRGMDWPTAWRALVPVYALGAILHAVFPLFAAPIWIIFFLYARMVLDGARLAEDPWRGHGSPRPYLVAFAFAMLLHLASFSLLQSTSSTSVLGSALVGGVAALTCAALFVAATAPPGVRERKAWIRAGAGFEILGALAGPTIILGVVRLSPPDQAVAVLAAPVSLAVLSSAGFLTAMRTAGRAAPAAARKAPRG